MLTTELRFGVHHGQSCPNTEITMNEQMITDMVIAMANNLDADQLDRLIVRMLSTLSNKLTDEEMKSVMQKYSFQYEMLVVEDKALTGTLSDMSEHLKENGYLVFEDEDELDHFLKCSDYLVFDDSNDAAEYLANNDWYVFSCIEDACQRLDDEGYMYFAEKSDILEYLDGDDEFLVYEVNWCAESHLDEMADELRNNSMLVFTDHDEAVEYMKTNGYTVFNAMAQREVDRAIGKETWPVMSRYVLDGLWDAHDCPSTKLKTITQWVSDQL